MERGESSVILYFQPSYIITFKFINSETSFLYVDTEYFAVNCKLAEATVGRASDSIKFHVFSFFKNYSLQSSFSSSIITLLCSVSLKKRDQMISWFEDQLLRQRCNHFQLILRRLILLECLKVGRISTKMDFLQSNQYKMEEMVRTWDEKRMFLFQREAEPK